MNTVARNLNEPAHLDSGDVKPHYLESLHLVERLHRRLLDVISDDFERRGGDDLSSVQALLLYNIGDEEFSPSELRVDPLRGPVLPSRRLRRAPAPQASRDPSGP